MSTNTPDAQAATKRLERVLTEDHVTRAEFETLQARFVSLSNDLNDRIAELEWAREGEEFLDDELSEAPKPAPLTGQELSAILKRHVCDITESGMDINLTEAAQEINKRLGVL